ncbi:MAG: YihY/virulence factor BrkB family protein [Actinomycetota bacterium]
MQALTDRPFVKRVMALPPVEVGIAVAKRGSADLLGPRTAALAFYGFLSLFPLLLLGLSLLGFVLDESQVREWSARIGETIPGLETLVGRNLEVLVRSRTSVGMIGLISLLWAATGGIGALQRALGAIFRVPDPGFFHARIDVFPAIAILGVLALATIGVTSAIMAVRVGGVLWLPVRILTLFAAGSVACGTFTLGYFLLTPERKLPLRAHLPGGALGAVAWIGLTLAGSWYTSHVVLRSSALYGSIGAVFGLLVILQLGASAALYAAELSATIEERRRGTPLGDPQPPEDAA